MKIAVGFDRRGARLRAAVISELVAQGHEVLDLGGDASTSAADYAAKTHDVARAVISGTVERAVIVARSGVGASFVANKIDGVRAGACSDTYTARRGAEYGMNVLCLGAGLLTRTEAAEIVRSFVSVKPQNAISGLRRLQPLALAGAGRARAATRLAG